MKSKDLLTIGLFFSIVILLVALYLTYNSENNYKEILKKATEEKANQAVEIQKLDTVNNALQDSYNKLELEKQNTQQLYDQLKESYKSSLSNRLSKDIPTANPLSDIDFFATKNSLTVIYPSINLTQVADTKSMEPYITSSYTIITTTQFNSQTLQKGDIISYRADWSVLDVLHRIIEVKTDSNGICYRTQGDHNQVEDPGCVKPSQVDQLVLGIIFNKKNGYPACDQNQNGIIKNNGVGCAPESAITFNSPLVHYDQDAIYPLCADTDPLKQFTVIKPDGKIYCYSSVGQ